VEGGTINIHQVYLLSKVKMGRSIKKGMRVQIVEYSILTSRITKKLIKNLIEEGKLQVL
jgi:hypothetical protein